MAPHPADASAQLSSVFEAELTAVFGYLLVRCGSRTIAEDLAADTFAAASQKFASGDGHEVTPAWLRTTAKRRLIDHWRRSGTRRRKWAQLVAAATHEMPPPDDPDDDVDRALTTLPARQRAALVLRYMDDLATAEVAQLLEMSPKAAESLLARARSNFARAYGVTDG